MKTLGIFLLLKLFKSEGILSGTYDDFVLKKCLNLQKCFQTLVSILFFPRRIFHSFDLFLVWKGFWNQRSVMKPLEILILLKLFKTERILLDSYDDFMLKKCLNLQMCYQTSVAILSFHKLLRLGKILLYSYDTFKA